MIHQKYKAQDEKELLKLLRELSPTDPTVKILYRGQTTERPLIASAHRAIEDQNMRQAIPVLQATWEQMAIEWLGDKVESLHIPLLGMAILQHYGFRSWFIDVTAEPATAIWFATHKYVSEQIAIQINDEPGTSRAKHIAGHAFASVAAARYVPTSDPGFLYVLWIPRELANSYIDFRSYAPKSAARIVRQQSGGVIDLESFGRAEQFIRAIIEIPPGLMLDSKLSLEMLFPPPWEDEVYAHLLRTPCVVSEQDARPHMSQARQAHIVPLYYSEQEHIARSLKYYRIIVGSYLHANVNLPDDPSVSVQLPMTNPGSFIPITRPDCDINLLLEWMEPDNLLKVLSPAAFTCWPADDIMLEIHPINGVRFIYSQHGYPLLRAIRFHMVRAETLTISTVWEDYGGYFAGLPAEFVWTAVGWQLTTTDQKDQVTAQLILLGEVAKYTYYLSIGKAFLTRFVDPDGFAYFHYYWTYPKESEWPVPIGERWSRD